MVLLVLAVAAGSGTAKERREAPVATPPGTHIGTVSGAAFVRLCADVGPDKAAGRATASARCVAYFQGVMDALESVKVMGAVIYCLPDDFTAEHGVHLFRQEAEIFPQVLDRPASDLIAGMFVKFFPCP
jgi:hypothetical protein